MSSFSSSHIEKKLKMMTQSQQSIQTLSLWCIHHRKHARGVVHLWYKELQKAKPKKKLALMYLANDILQNSRRKGTEFSKEFGVVLPNALSHCTQTLDDKLLESLKRILNIWSERNVYDAVFIDRLSISLNSESSGFGESTEEKSTTPPVEMAPAVQETEFSVIEFKKPANPPDPDELVRRLQELENSATQDAVIRERIASLPAEVTDPTFIDKVEDLESALKLKEKIDSACNLLSDYNTRLSDEQTDRDIAHKMLLDYTDMQKYSLAITEEKLEEYLQNLQKVNEVRKQLQSHLENLPDLSKLPNPVPLPSAGDLFAAPPVGHHMIAMPSAEELFGSPAKGGFMKP